MHGRVAHATKDGEGVLQIRLCDGGDRDDRAAGARAGAATAACECEGAEICAEGVGLAGEEPGTGWELSQLAGWGGLSGEHDRAGGDGVFGAWGYANPRAVCGEHSQRDDVLHGVRD